MSTPADDTGDVAALRVEVERLREQVAACPFGLPDHCCCDCDPIEVRQELMFQRKRVDTALMERAEFEAQRDEARAEADRLRGEVERLRKYAPSAEVEALLSRSSLGTDEAKAARDSVSPDAGRLVVRLSEVMAERDRLRVTLRAVGDDHARELAQLADVTVSYLKHQQIAEARVASAAALLQPRPCRQCDGTGRQAISEAGALRDVGIEPPTETCQLCNGEGSITYPAIPAEELRAALAADPVSLADVREPDDPNMDDPHGEPNDRQRALLDAANSCPYGIGAQQWLRNLAKKEQ